MQGDHARRKAHEQDGSGVQRDGNGRDDAAPRQLPRPRHPADIEAGCAVSQGHATKRAPEQGHPHWAQGLGA
ncbi:hypothetical protein [Rhodovulum sp.]|uniref:hypothetical protein n=1 Tax=Rhodovulum sp. TaxID=34009 RepID=UPI001792A243|nr:hypothetical protein [Rhodovulum sp.]HDR29334.1 hypothetical protein [Rhodovulum sp.]